VVYLGTAHVAGGAGQEGWKWIPGKNDGGPPGGPVGGRLDIGPEQLNPARPTLWLGSWTVEAAGPREATMTSDPCPATGAQLVRAFTLAEEGSQLTVTQTIRNVSDRVRPWSLSTPRPKRTRQAVHIPRACMYWRGWHLTGFLRPGSRRNTSTGVAPSPTAEGRSVGYPDTAAYNL
jgi:hypothetical protein